MTKAAKAFMVRLLAKCKKGGITALAINCSSKSVPVSGHYGRGSICQHPMDAGCSKREIGPAIWRIVEDLKIGFGCGNSGQHQVIQTDLLIDGVYVLRRGKWKKI